MGATNQDVSTTIYVRGGETVEAKLASLDAAVRKLSGTSKAATGVSSLAGRETARYSVAAGQAAGSSDRLAQQVSKLSRAMGALAPIGGEAAFKMASVAGGLDNVIQFAPKMEESLTKVRHALVTQANAGDKAARSMLNLVPTMGQLGAAAVAVAAAVVAGKTIGTLLDAHYVSDLGHEMRKLQNEFEASAVAAQKLEQINKQLAAFGLHAGLVSEGEAMLRKARAESAAQLEAVEKLVYRGNEAAAKQIESLMLLKDRIGNMSDAVLTRYRDALLAATEAVKANGDEVSDAAASTLGMADAMLKSVSPISLGTEAMNAQWASAKKLWDEQDKLAESLTTIADTTKMSAGEQKDLATALGETFEASNKLGEAISRKLADQIARLGVEADITAGKFTGLRETQDAWFAANTANATGGWAGAEMDKLRKAQAEAWRKEDEERAAREKGQIDEIAEHIRTKYGLAYEEGFAVFNNQWNTWVESSAAHVKAVLGAAASAFKTSTSASAQPSQASGIMGKLQGQVASGGMNQAEAILRAEKIRDQMKAELDVIKRRFSRRGSFKEAVAAKQQRIDEMDESIEAMRGESSLGTQFNKRWRERAAEGKKSNEQRTLERQLERQARAAEDTNKEVKRLGSVMARNASATESVAAGVQQVAMTSRTSGAALAASASYLADLSGRSKLPDAFESVRPRSGRGSSGGSRASMLGSRVG